MARTPFRNALPLLFALSSGASLCACGGDEILTPIQASFDVRPGVEIVTVTNAEARAPLTLYNAEGVKQLTLLADEYGQAHFAYVPFEHVTFDTQEGTIPIVQGTTLKKGDGYYISNDSVDPPDRTAPFSVLGIEDLPSTDLYDRQTLNGVPYSLFGADDKDMSEGFQYIEVRDGVKLSVMVRFPDPLLWGKGPWPTVIEYSGYSPSRPDSPEPGSRIATLLGYASVGVNMRGTGCSGGVFDVFNPAQHADGYDVVEAVARQPWVLHNRVGMVGLSYSGISQLFVASTNPPSLAAITPQSVIADPWEQQWPGGVYNAGFTRQWLSQRDSQAASGGQSWTDKVIESGDELCEQHQILRNQNIDFQSFFRKLEYYPDAAKDRSLPKLVAKIEAPTYLTGAWHDEQTGAQFGAMLDNFTNANATKFTMYNGRHPDGYSPLVLTRWLEFLSLYVGKSVLRLDEGLRNLAGKEIAKEFGVEGLGFEPDRFADFDDDDYDGVLAAYEKEPQARVLFESGAAGPEPGAPKARFDASFSSWPPAEASPTSWFFQSNGELASTSADTPGSNSYLHDPEAGAKTFFGPKGYQLMPPLWDINWTEFPAGRSLSYVSAPFENEVAVAGPGYAELFFASGVDDVNVQVTLTEITPNDEEFLLQSGWLRLGHRKVDEAASDTLRIVRNYKEEDFEPLKPDTMVSAKVSLPSFAHVFRKGSRLRVVVSTPGRNHGTWEFEAPGYAGTEPTQRVFFGKDQASRIVLPVVTGISSKDDFPVCPSLRGQPCRPYQASTNSSD